MDLKDRLKMMLGIEENTEEVVLMLQARLEDGTIISSDAEEMATGIVINVVAEDGSVFPLAEGNYILEDGGEFSVDSEGVVLEYNPSEEIDEVTEEDATDEDVVAEDDSEEVAMSENSEILDAVGMVMKELLEEVKKDLENLRSEFDSMQSEKLGLEYQVDSVEKEKEELAKQVVELSAEPSAEPIKSSKFAKDSNVKMKNNKPSKMEWSNMTTKERVSWNLSNINK